MIDKQPAAFLGKTLEDWTSERALLQRQLKINAAREHLLDFIEYTMPDPNYPDDVERTMFDAQPYHKLFCEALERVDRGECLRLALSVPPQHGKLIADDTPVLTTHGWKTHGALRVGDRVFGADGRPTEVVGVSAPGEATLRVRFDDGASVAVHPRHEWLVWDRNRHRTRVMETQEMAQAGLQHCAENRARFGVSHAPCVEFEEKCLPLEPYVLGAWLGDGSSSKCAITHAPIDTAVIAEIERVGVRASAVCTHRTTGVLTTYFCGARGAGGGVLHRALKTTGLLNNKHIPEEYKTSSVAQRLRLLAGLIDTDGYVYAPGRRVCFSNTNARMIGDVADVVRSLGWRATVSAVQPITSSSGIEGKQVVYQLTFSPSVAIPTQLPRKQIPGWAVMRRRNGIVAIEECPPVRGKCIQVARADGVYLVGRYLTPTHNSLVASRRFPAWYMGRHPHKNFMFGTYSDTFAAEFGGDVREIMQMPLYNQVFPNALLAPGSKAKDAMRTTRGGRMSFLGRGGAGTGKPADLFVIDDPLKNAEEADSPTIIRQLHDWFTKVVFTRCHVGSAIIIIHTRWTEDDLIGRLCDPDHPDYDPEVAGAWTYINIPAVLSAGPIADAMGVKLEVQTNPVVVSMFGSKPIASLWPARFPLRHLAEAKRQDKNGFEALYQGRPTPEDGSYFTRQMLVEHNNPTDYPSNLRMYAASDHALTEKEQNDANCFGAFGLDEKDDIWIMPELVWERFETDRLVEEMLAIMLSRKPMVWFAEDEHIKKSILPFLRKRMVEEKVYTLVQGLPSSRDLRTRARSIQGRMGMRKVHFPAWMHWWPQAKNELLKFPKGAHDDFVSFMSLIGRGLLDEYAAAPETKTEGNVIRVGTIAWIKKASDQRRRREKQRKASAGF